MSNVAPGAAPARIASKVASRGAIERPTPSAVLRVRRLTKSFGPISALREVDVDIQAGEVLGLLGPNGAGKSTLISTVAGLLKPDTGSVSICGVDMAENSLRARSFVGVAGQDVGLYLQLSVLGNLRFFASLCRLSPAEREERIEELADALDLTALLDRRAHALSGGEKRRAHAAIAMLPRPPLLLFDEPTAGVDVQTRNRLLAVVRSLADEGAAICYTTHYLHEAESIATSAVIIDEGVVIARGKMQQLIQDVGDPLLEVRVDGPLPAELARIGSVRGESVVHIPAADAHAAIEQALRCMGRSRIQSLDVVQPSLESVYLRLTGRRFQSTRDDDRAA
jgi:ABC-2 type transport system ATP-binding protein